MRVPLADLVALEDRGRVLRSRWGLGCLCFRWWVKGLRGLCPGCRVCRVGVLWLLWANREHPSLCSISEGRLFLFVVLMGGRGVKPSQFRLSLMHARRCYCVLLTLTSSLYCEVFYISGPAGGPIILRSRLFKRGCLL